MRTNSTWIPFHLYLLLVVTSSLFACSTKEADLPGAPLGEKPPLEKLADAYRREAGNMPVSPMGLTAQGRKKFLHNVFSSAGYSYRKTLRNLAELDVKERNKNHRDLAELLRLPHHALESSVKAEIYDKDELNWISKIEDY